MLVDHIHWLQDFPTVLEETTTGSTYHYFCTKEYIPNLRSWIQRLETPILRTQEKSLLIIDGAVKSGKTTVARVLLPFLLQELRQEGTMKEDFCFAYFDLSALAGKNTLQEKWKTVFDLFSIHFGDIWEDKVPQVADYHLKVQFALHGLKGYNVHRWIISLDEFHFLFNRLDDLAMETMAEQMKLVLLDDKSPCYFVLAGSTQATFWWSIHKARPNGLNLLTGATTITTPFTSSQLEIDVCKQVLMQKENSQAQNVQEILDLVALSNVVTLSQASAFEIVCS